MPTSLIDTQDGGRPEEMFSGPQNYELFGDTSFCPRPPDEGENWDLAARWACTDG